MKGITEEPKGKKCIVKVQISLASSDGVSTVLVYTKDRKDRYEGPVPAWLLKKQRDPKAFWIAIVPDEPGYITLLHKAPWQDW